MSLRADTEFPEHEKLLGEEELREALERIWQWMSRQGRTIDGAGSDRVAICKLRPRMIEETIYCDTCEGTGKDISQLTTRQTQVLRHVRAIREVEKPYKKAEHDEHDEHREALAELELFTAELEDCGTCYGKGKATAYRRGSPEWTASYANPRDFLMDMLGIDRRAFKAESELLFAQLGKQAEARPTKADEAPPG